MKKNFKKLALNKKQVSDLSAKIKGGRRKPIDTLDTHTTGPTGPTALTMCYICPPELQNNQYVASEKRKSRNNNQNALT